MCYDTNMPEEEKEHFEGSERVFASGASRDHGDKPNFEGFFSPIVLSAFAEYMHKKRKLSNGSTRDGDDWQKGIPKDVYIDSLLRHAIDLWLHHRGFAGAATDSLDDCLAGLFFNTQGYWFETLLEVKGLRRPKKQDNGGTAGVLTTEPTSVQRKEARVLSVQLDALRK